jgi:hypothetical protein
VSDTAAGDPQSALADALGELRLSAGCPSLRDISRELRRLKHRDSVSHETVRRALMCTGSPRWRTVAAIVVVLAELSVVPRDAQAEVRRIFPLWEAVTGPPYVDCTCHGFRAERGMSESPLVSEACVVRMEQ